MIVDRLGNLGTLFKIVFEILVIFKLVIFFELRIT